MLYRYFRFTKKRVAVFLGLSALILILQAVLTGSLLARQQITVDAGNSEAAVIGILDKTEIVRQKFEFDRKVVLKEFKLSFGSFERDEVGDELNIQMTDGDNNIVYETKVPVDDIVPNNTYLISMDHTVTIPKGVTCCIKITCSSDKHVYDTIPTLNTTNRTDPNTYMSTLKMQTRKKCLNISYTYYYRQIAPLLLIILEFAVLFVLCFERVTEYGVILRRKKQKEARRIKQGKEIAEHARQKRSRSKNTSAKVRYSKDRNYDKKRAAKLLRKKKRQNRGQWDKNKKNHSLKEFVKWCLVEPRVIWGIRIAVAVINPLLVMFAIELMNEALLTKTVWVWIFTWLLLLALQYLFYAVIGNMSVAMIVTDCILFPSGLANLVLMNVRGTPFLPGDLMALGTAAEVAGTYKISLTPMQFVMLPAFIIWCFFLLKIKSRKKESALRRKIVKRLVPLAMSCCVIGILYNSNILTACNIQDNVWNKVSSCRTNGFYLNFFLNLHYLSVAKPSGYSQEAVKDILDDFERESKQTTGRQTSKEQQFTTNKDYAANTSLNGQKPNIILIMNESLTDYSLIGNPAFNEDPLPFMHGLKKNTIFGKDYVSIYGAGTSNSEFEAMTGNSIKFFPSGANVYQQFMHDSTFSMAYYLKSLGYSTQAVHPSSGANWNRVATYESMRFDRFVTIEDFKNPEYVRYISDKESYKKVIELYENKKQGTPLFAFDMTIQNHGGYLTNTNWKNPIYLKGSYYQEAKEFLSATRVSDDAFKYLINYFKKQKEPTIICMFGDHHPSIEVEFYEEILKKPQSQWDLQDIQKRYAVPFIIWANYDIAEGDDAVISNNYLENMLLKQAGIELPLYNQYIEKVSEEIPAMNVNGYMDYQGVWHNYGSDETDGVKKLLDNYEILQYGYYSDMDKKTMTKLFQMPE